MNSFRWKQTTPGNRKPWPESACPARLPGKPPLNVPQPPSPCAGRGALSPIPISASSSHCLVWVLPSPGWDTEKLDGGLLCPQKQRFGVLSPGYATGLLSVGVVAVKTKTRSLWRPWWPEPGLAR